MAPLNSHFDGTRQRDEPTIFSEIRDRMEIPPWGINSSWLAASKEKWTLRISMACTRYFRNAFRSFYRATSARDLSPVVYGEDRTENFYLFRDRSRDGELQIVDLRTKRGLIGIGQTFSEDVQRTHLTRDEKHQFTQPLILFAHAM